ncbi:MAG: Dabb family protein [Selenomonadaceae bacterium]|nr:Dabb family protein [Selenomonadaceae bacterium]
MWKKAIAAAFIAMAAAAPMQYAQAAPVQTEIEQQSDAAEKNGIVHIVMLRFKSEETADEGFELARVAFADLQKEIPTIEDVKIRRNCVAREGNFSVMIEMVLSDEETLDKYLKHPLHVGFAQKCMPNMNGRASFDYPREK